MAVGGPPVWGTEGELLQILLNLLLNAAHALLERDAANHRVHIRT